MSENAKPASGRILVVRLGAMGDIIHALPAVAALKQSHPGARLTWLVEPKWAALLEGNPFVDRVLILGRGSAGGLLETLRELRAGRFDFAVDFQGLLKSALCAKAARPERVHGFHESQLRERAAGLFYSHKTLSQSVHVVDRNLDLAIACGARADPSRRLFPLPPGRPEGDLPPGDFVLASPLAGWQSKQWPMEYYDTLGERLKQKLGVPLVLNGLPDSSLPHRSGLPGLIHATRRAMAVVGVDSGPLHLAAALGKPGVAIFGPTDPARNGPYGGSLRVLRAPAAFTTYKRGGAIDDAMRQITPDQVFDSLLAGSLAR
ncbi:MAG TPA: glycosyltransferase family 9 protein [Candidatus Acidoferrales bacterium]|nr:glycosyltransferase family 9 protein [Candidatus Acidoferrales bacterium]